jgi:hypothetical protein
MCSVRNSSCVIEGEIYFRLARQLCAKVCIDLIAELHCLYPMSITTTVQSTTLNLETVLVIHYETLKV